MKGKGRIYNHSLIDLLVIENDSGVPLAHVLKGKHKSPKQIDADGFKRRDGGTILGHDRWWKVVNYTRSDIFQLGDDLLIPISFMLPVGDKEFGDYEVVSGPWAKKWST